MELLDQIKDKARKLQNRIVLPEGNEIRTLKAAEIALKDNLAAIILLGNPDEIKSITQKEGIDITDALIVNPLDNSRRPYYAELMCEIRKSKGLTIDEDRKSVV